MRKSTENKEKIVKNKRKVIINYEKNIENHPKIWKRLLKTNENWVKTV